MKKINDQQILDIEEAMRRLGRVEKTMKEGNSLLEDIIQARIILKVVVSHLE